MQFTTKSLGTTNHVVGVGIEISREHSDSAYILQKKKKNNLNKATRIQSIPRDLSRLISIKIDSQQIARPSKPSTIFPNARM